MNMEKETENKIIELYLSGVGSTTIVKLLPNLTIRKILQIIHNNGVFRDNKIPAHFYDNCWFDNAKWHTKYKCDVCNKDIVISSNEKSLLHRNIKYKKTCKPCSLIKQIGVGNPFYGKQHTKESINQISKSRIGKCCGKNNAMSNPKYVKIIQDKAIARWCSDEIEPLRLKMSNLMKQRIINGEIKGYIRSKAEDELLNILKNKNIIAIPNYRIVTKNYDIYIPKYNILIEYNGDYWHCNPIKYNENYFHTKKNKSAKEIWEYDKNKLDLVKNLGYTCIVIWESEYKKNKNILLELIEKYEK